MYPAGDHHSTDPVSYSIRIGQQKIELVVPVVSVDSITHAESLCVDWSDPDCSLDHSNPFSTLLPSDENVVTDIDYSIWPYPFQFLITVIWHIGNSPRYSAQQAVDITWRTLLCSHEGAPVTVAIQRSTLTTFVLTSHTRGSFSTHGVAHNMYMRICCSLSKAATLYE